VLWVIAAQKAVYDLEQGLRRIRVYAFPLADARIRQALGRGSRISKVLIIYSEVPGRGTATLVREALGS
jgi:hypothetical protein